MEDGVANGEDEDLEDQDLEDEVEQDDADGVDEDDDEELDEEAVDEQDGEDDDDTDVDHDLREDGPFDITEVDLEADEIERLDFGALILTPFDDMQMQLQVDQSTGQVQSALVMAGQSAIEVALFAAPARTSMVSDVIDEMAAAATEAGGESGVHDGPFGPEIRRMIPVQTEEGEAYHVSRTWFAQGPRWLLRGVLMGEAAQTGEAELEGDGELLFEFFCNVVVKRGDEPMVPGDLIPMELPPELAAQQQEA
ncbi:DUF3710 domain-containing protein [Propionibacteriaceae bacterium G1746]